MELSYAVRVNVVLKYFGQLCHVVVALTLAPLLVSLVFGEYHLSARYVVVIVLLAVIGVLLARVRAPSNMQVNEAIAVIASIFLFTPFAMTYPMMGSGLSFLDALFEAISGATTTGLTTLPSVENLPRTFLFARSWMQWYGGLGIVVLSVALVVRPGVTAKRLAVTEADADDLIGGTRAHARRVLLVYGVLTAVGILLLVVAGANVFQAVLYAFAAISTGGFAPNDSSLAGLGGWPIQALATAICLAGAISLAFYHRLFRDRNRFGLGTTQLVAVSACGLIASLAVVACMHWAEGRAWLYALRHGPLLAFSAQTTAGFSTLSFDQLGNGSKLILIPAMMIGGGVGSTAGGFKVLRLLILIQLLRVTVARTCLTRHAVMEPRLGRHRLGPDEIQDALLVILLFSIVVIASWIPFVVMGYAPLDSLFEVVSATGTVGLTAGITSAELPILLKIILCADMLMGRLEIIVWLVVLYPRTWFGRRMR